MLLTRVIEMVKVMHDVIFDKKNTQDNQFVHLTNIIQQDDNNY